MEEEKNFGGGERSGAGAFDANMLAVATAERLAFGRDKSELEEICKFLQLLQAALRTYM